MLRYGKTTQSAIAAMSRLADLYDGGKALVSSGDIAKTRNLSRPLVAKLLTTLSQAGLVRGSPGPGGGYTLTKPPSQISLYDVAVLFERADDLHTCPFGPGWCGHDDPCPLHAPLLAFHDELTSFLRRTHFDVFKGKDPQRASEPGQAREPAQSDTDEMWAGE
jgi:Rrf2 family iron-sulfur cluster assembly transcriptional regulator